MENLHDPEHVYYTIKAEIPPQNDAVLRKLVLPHMNHGPCGEHSSASLWIKEWYCGKQFPEIFKDENGSDEDISHSYLQLRGRSPGYGREEYIRRTTVQSPQGSFNKGLTVDSSWAVP